jgi:hypothetical protein
MVKITQGMRQAVDHEKKGTSRAALYYGIFFVGMAVIIGGLVYFQIWRRKQTEWELNDPMALVKELDWVHQLSDPEKRFMQELSTKYALPSPLKLFVEPKYLLEAMESDSFISARSLVRRLLSKLFDITPEGNTATPGSIIDTSLHSQFKQ